MSLHPHTSEEPLATFLTHNHTRLETQFQSLLEAMAAGAPEARELWGALDHELLAHMEAEERYVLPAFAKVDHDEAKQLLREHGLLREQLLELGVAVDLHAIRFERSREFINRLRAHAAREDRLLYRWADLKLSADLATATRRHARR
ncbi:MAG: hemerythrin domain-containing protein [Proteobacteria bacterium]|nr:hemerythrin domain-containing protein [Pseudomonadota bacterium]